MVTEIMLMHSLSMVHNGMILMVTATVITRMEHKVIGSLMIQIDGKILTVMVMQMKMICSLMITLSGTILMVMVMAII